MSGVCAIVGMGPGIGLSLARRFGREGLALGLLARSEAKLASYEGELTSPDVRVRGFAADAARPGSLRKALVAVEGSLGPIDVLLYNVSSPWRTGGLALPADDLQSDLGANVTGALIAAQSVAEGMRARGKGTLLFTGGGLAHRPDAAVTSLSVGKAGLRALVLCLAQELRDTPLRVSTVTVAGMVKPGTFFDPDRIADHYWQLHAGPAAPPAESVFAPNDSSSNTR